MISGIDHVVGRVRKAKAKGAREHLIVFSGDNGCYRGRRVCELNNYENHLGYHYLIQVYRHLRGRTAPQMALGIDLPAFIDYADLPLPESYQGQAYAKSSRGITTELMTPLVYGL